MTPRNRTLSLAGAALAVLAITGCGALPVQPVVSTAGTTSARMIDPDDDGAGPGPTVTPGGETTVPSVDRTHGKGPKQTKKPKRNGR